MIEYPKIETLYDRDVEIEILGLPKGEKGVTE